jgi:murein L,D-transpeptidase YcbB/YkuD
MIVDLPTLRGPWKDTGATRILRVLLQTPTGDLTAAVKQAQAGSGLAADGIVGPDTWRALLAPKT